MINNQIVLKFENFSIHQKKIKKNSELIKNINFSIQKDQIVGLVGESGSGKTLTAMSIIQLLDSSLSTKGQIHFNQKDLNSLTQKEIQAVRGEMIGCVMQDPMSCLNPVLSIKTQMLECFKGITHQNLSKVDKTHKIINVLEDVGIPEAEERIHDYPHQFSGGMLQRVCIAMSIINNPKLIILDEPTTALDVATQEKFIQLTLKMKQKYKMSLLWITHDLSLIQKIADYLVIMKDGQIIEQGITEEIFKKPKEQYTQDLIAHKPSIFDNPHFEKFG